MDVMIKALESFGDWQDVMIDKVSFTPENYKGLPAYTLCRPKAVGGVVKIFDYRKTKH